MCGLLIAPWYLLPSGSHLPDENLFHLVENHEWSIGAVWVLGPSHPLRMVCNGAHHVKAYMVWGYNTRWWSCCFIVTERKYLTTLRCVLVTLQKVHKYPSRSRTSVHSSVRFQEMLLLARKHHCLGCISSPPALSQSLCWWEELLERWSPFIVT